MASNELRRRTGGLGGIDGDLVFRGGPEEESESRFNNPSPSPAA